jgi:LuxR family transcriptional regulator, maltose regulon positive regulatory protein
MVAAELPFDLVEVKLGPPLIRQGTVAKADVIARLSAASVPLATVTAPAGYGKTTMLARWAEVDPRPFAWVALDPRDDDAVVFLRHIAAAIHRILPLPGDALEALAGPGGSLWATRLPRVGTALAAADTPVVLVLDDLHAVGNPACIDVVAELARYVPAGSLIVIASREEPALPLARWRAQGWLLEFGVADLRLDEEQAGLLLEHAGVELEPDELTELTARTEGWPAGLYLAALSHKAGAVDARSESVLSGDDRYISEYFRSELLSRLPTADAQFLTRTSVLERMRGGLCDAVLETTRSDHTLEELVRTNGFVVRLDVRGEWYRYHHLFGQLLRDELERSEPEIIPALNARAMAWCIANDLPEEAIAYGQAAGETSTVAGLIDTLALPAYYDGRRETVDRWLSWFAENDLAHYPALAVYGAWFRALTGQPDEAARWLSIADGAASGIPLSDGSATIEPWVATLRAHMMRNGPDQALADANLALGELAPGSPMIPVALGIRGVAHALLGANAHAAVDFAAAIETGLASGALEDVYIAEAQLALLAVRHGAWLEASQYAQSAQSRAGEAGLSEYSTSALPHAVSARIALHEGRPDDARAALARAHRLRPLLDHGIPWLTVTVGLELVRSHLALGEAAAARTVLTETKRVLQLRPNLGTLVEEAQELGDRVEASSGPAGAWAMSLTGAEMRLLPYLATHLTFPEIAERLFISRNTVKTEAVAIYRKLTASSRSEAIERAIEVGLLESSILPPRAHLTQEG